jgi:two-component system, NarL family, response regulator LiaR
MQVVAEARNGHEAVQISAHTLPDIIVMDLLMPVMDGITATREILRQNPEVGILILTSSLEEDHRQAAYQAEARAYLTKIAE